MQEKSLTLTKILISGIIGFVIALIITYLCSNIFHLSLNITFLVTLVNGFIWYDIIIFVVNYLMPND